MRNTAYYKFPAINLINRYDPNMDDETLAEVFGVVRSTVCSWRNDGRNLSPYDADKYAIRIGLHPCLVWDDWGEPGETVKERRARGARERYQQRKGRLEA
jgi:hypothetical protein